MERLYEMSAMYGAFDADITPEEGSVWLRKAAATGDVYAESQLCSAAGYVLKNYAEAIPACTAAARKNNHSSEEVLRNISPEGFAALRAEREAAQQKVVDKRFAAAYAAARSTGGERNGDAKLALIFSDSGLYRVVRITSHDDRKILLYKVVINRHFDSQICTLVKSINDDYLVRSPMSLGNSVDVVADRRCDNPVKVEVFTDRGMNEFEF